MSNNQIVCGRCGRAGHIRTDCIMPIRGLPNMTEIVVTCPAMPEIPRVYQNVGGLLTDYRYWNQDVSEWTKVFEDFMAHVEKLHRYFVCTGVNISPTISEGSSVTFSFPDTPQVREFYERVFVDGIDPNFTNQPPQHNAQAPQASPRYPSPPRVPTPFRFAPPSPSPEACDNDGQNSEGTSIQDGFSPAATPGAENTSNIEEDLENVDEGQHGVQHGRLAEVTEESEEEGLFVN